MKKSSVIAIIFMCATLAVFWHFGKVAIQQDNVVITQSFEVQQQENTLRQLRAQADKLLSVKAEALSKETRLLEALLERQAEAVTPEDKAEIDRLLSESLQRAKLLQIDVDGHKDTEDRYELQN